MGWFLAQLVTFGGIALFDELQEEIENATHFRHLLASAAIAALGIKFIKEIDTLRRMEVSSKNRGVFAQFKPGYPVIMDSSRITNSAKVPPARQSPR